MTPVRLLFKFRCLRQAWIESWSEVPDPSEVAVALCPALSETLAGDVWVGADGLLGTQDDEKNWGASILRALNSIECAALAGAAAGMLETTGLPERGDYVEFDGYHTYRWVTDRGMRLALTPAELAAVESIVPIVSKGHEKRAKEMQAALVSGGIALPKASIHCDSAPGKGAYGIFFANFDTDVEAAKYYLRILVGSPAKPKAAKAILRTGGDERALATAMHRASYFLGRYKKDEVLPDGRTGFEANVDAYTKWISPWRPQILAAIKGQGLSLAPEIWMPEVLPVAEAGIDIDRVMAEVGLSLRELSRQAVEDGLTNRFHEDLAA